MRAKSAAAHDWRESKEGSMETWCGRRVLGFLLVLLCVVLSHCAGLGTRLETPRVTLADMKIEEIKALEAITRVELRVVNINDVSLEIDGVDCTIELNNREFGTGVLNTKTTVPPRGTALVPMTIYSSLIDVGRGVFEARGDRKFTYKIKGRLHLGGGLARILPFSSEGELSL
jgi:LEA14-like dessication related protein